MHPACGLFLRPTVSTDSCMCLLQPDTDGRTLTKLVATLGPSSSSVEALTQLLLAGMSVRRPHCTSPQHSTTRTSHALRLRACTARQAAHVVHRAVNL